MKRKGNSKHPGRIHRKVCHSTIRKLRERISLVDKSPFLEAESKHTKESQTDYFGRTDTFKRYMLEVCSYPLLAQDDECRLAVQIHSGKTDRYEFARETLITSNLRLVVKIAQDFKGLGLSLQDLISEGNIGLMRASEKFLPEKGAKFSSYAAWWIKQSMRRAIANQRNTIRIPVQSAHKMSQLKKVMQELTVVLARKPTLEEVAERAGFSIRTVNTLLLADHHMISLQDQIKQGEDGTVIELISDPHAITPDRAISDTESLNRMWTVLERLDEREKSVLVMRFGLNGEKPQTLEDVSRKVGRTRERVRQIQNQALGKLRHFLKDEASFGNE